MNSRHDNWLRSSATTAVLLSAFLLSNCLLLEAGEDAKSLVAYVGTFSSPLHDILPTQVDRPPGNGHGIHIFSVDRETGAMTPSGVVESGVSPNCFAVNTAGTLLYSTNET